MRKVSRLSLIVGLVMLLVLPATTLSQGAVQSGWAGPDVRLDGRLGPGEWANAARVRLNTLVEADDLSLLSVDGPLGNLDQVPEVSPQQVTGWLRLMNDAQFFYAAATLDIGAPPGDPDYAMSMFHFLFEDEPVRGDGLWAANLCSQNPEEGALVSEHMHDHFPPGPDWDYDYDYFTPAAEEGYCYPPQMDPPGYRRGLGYGPLTFETRMDLQTSPLDLSPGDCFYAAAIVYDAEAHFAEMFYGYGAGVWPADLVDGEPNLPDDLVRVCLAEEEEFVPEPASLALLGTGLAGLGGYAALRWRGRRS
jgi:hypothetical protein